MSPEAVFLKLPFQETLAMALRLISVAAARRSMLRPNTYSGSIHFHSGALAPLKTLAALSRTMAAQDGVPETNIGFTRRVSMQGYDG